MAAEDQVRMFDNFSMPGLTSVQVSTGYLEAAGQVYLSGAPLIDNGAGSLVTAADDVTTPIIVGFATYAASGVTDNETSVTPALSGLEFEATLESSSPGDHALAQTDLFAKYGFEVNGSNLWYVNQAETASPAVVVIALIDPIGTVQGRVRVRLLNRVCLGNL